MNKEGRVIKCLSDKFVVSCDGENITCHSRKKVKTAGGVLVGDFACISDEGGDGYFTLGSVKQRKNSLIRPPIANLDQLIIILAPVPAVDYYLIDKLVINAHSQNLDIVLCLNKTDIAPNSLFNDIVSQYSKSVNNIVNISAAKNDISALVPLLCGRLSCLAGQSAVGKSSLVNALYGLSRQVGELSGNQRGKNTTTSVELIEVTGGGFIADSPGFSMLDIHNINYAQLDLYYDEYVEQAHNCKYNRCTHTAEPNCAVKALVQSGQLNKQRYERYINLFNELKSQKPDKGDYNKQQR